MKNVKILDCTLRDGGRIIDCKFEDDTIANIADELCHAGIDILEIGFLRDKSIVVYNGNSTFFTDIGQMNRFAKYPDKVLYTTFVDYGMYDVSGLKPAEQSNVKGIRIGFTRKQFLSDKEGIATTIKDIKSKGYKVFAQGVNTSGYSDSELLDVILMVNEIKPFSFGIVDTYGGMYLEDISYIYKMVEHNLDMGICIDIHSHNNFQSSFAFSQEIMRIADYDRKLIFDATLNGMGKCAGNLNTELIVDYLNRKKGGNYNLDIILDCIDLNLKPLEENNAWGYSIPAFMAGIYKSHPNNIIYLTEKYRLKSRDIKYIVSGISEDKRQRYDYDNICRIYQEYFSTVIDDSSVIEELQCKMSGKNVTILAPGSSIETDKEKILRYNEALQDHMVISINFVPSDIQCDYYFFANAIHWGRYAHSLEHEKCILTSNISEETEGGMVVNYTSLIVEDSRFPDNSTIMLLNLLAKLGVKRIGIAGFDGLKENEDNYVNHNFLDSTHGFSFSEINEEIRKLFRNFIRRVSDSTDIKFITHSLYDDL